MSAVLREALARTYRLADRHRMSPGKALGYEMLVRAYRYQPWLRRISRPFYRARKPLGWIFMTGCYNAGTTLVKDIVALHPDVQTLPVEGDLLTTSLSNYEDGGYYRCMYGNRDAIASDRREGAVDADALIRDWAPWMNPKSLFLDKSISHVMRLHHLARTFPDARFVLVTRNVEPVVSGILRRSRPGPRAARSLGASTYPPDLLRRQWCHLYRTALADLPPDRALIVAYETLLADPVGSARKLYESLGLHVPPIRLTDGSLIVGELSLPLRCDGRSDAQGLDSAERLLSGIERVERSMGRSAASIGVGA